MIGVANYPPGFVCFPMSDLSRYSDFLISTLFTQVPQGTKVWPVKGTLVARNKNNAVREMLERTPQAEWFFSMGDDHTWPNDLIPRLLDRNVDVVAPVALKRKPPFGPVLYRAKNPDGTYRRYQLSELPKGGLLEVVNCSTAGMLIKRRVLEAVVTDTGHWFTVGRVSPDGMGEDLNFVDRCIAKGFKVYADLDITYKSHPHRRSIGHISPMTVYLAQREDGTYYVELDLDYGVGVGLSEMVPERA